ncbi:uncharacterized protein L201_003694 [Kwoniella dendrophila CBS 6074]|uniref:Uncharacterized protein n=1 Tax=Kwoniella dendrophila CBS 6074 TaxID=1295534 RepID=A0AAX4JTM0_9TREE
MSTTPSLISRATALMPRLAASSNLSMQDQSKIINFAQSLSDHNNDDEERFCSGLTREDKEYFGITIAKNWSDKYGELPPELKALQDSNPDISKISENARNLEYSVREFMSNMASLSNLEFDEAQDPNLKDDVHDLMRDVCELHFGNGNEGVGASSKRSSIGSRSSIYSGSSCSDYSDGPYSSPELSTYSATSISASA